VPARDHPKALKMATAALSKIVGVRTAAKVAGVDWRTVERWVKGYQDGDEAEWRSARELAQARHLEALIKGDTRGMTAFATSAGISARNEAYARLKSQRDARRTEQDEGAQPEPEAPWVAAYHKLEGERPRLMYWELFLPWEQDREPLLYEHLPDTPVPADAPSEDAMLQVVEHYAALPDPEVAARMAVAEDAERAYNHSLIPSPPVPVAPAPIQPPPTPPSQPIPAPPTPVNPGLRVLRDDELADFQDEAHLWRRLE
jgi:hypothetical protein